MQAFWQQFSQNKRLLGQGFALLLVILALGYNALGAFAQDPVQLDGFEIETQDNSVEIILKTQGGRAQVSTENHDGTLSVLVKHAQLSPKQLKQGLPVVVDNKNLFIGRAVPVDADTVKIILPNVPSDRYAVSVRQQVGQRQAQAQSQPKPKAILKLQPKVQAVRPQSKGLIAKAIPKISPSGTIKPVMAARVSMPKAKPRIATAIGLAPLFNPQQTKPEPARLVAPRVSTQIVAEPPILAQKPLAPLQPQPTLIVKAKPMLVEPTPVVSIERVPADNLSAVGIKDTVMPAEAMQMPEITVLEPEKLPPQQKLVLAPNALAKDPVAMSALAEGPKKAALGAGFWAGLTGWMHPVLAEGAVNTESWLDVLGGWVSSAGWVLLGILFTLVSLVTLVVVFVLFRNFAARRRAMSAGESYLPSTGLPTANRGPASSLQQSMNLDYPEPAMPVPQYQTPEPYPYAEPEPSYSPLLPNPSDDDDRSATESMAVRVPAPQEQGYRATVRLMPDATGYLLSAAQSVDEAVQRFARLRYHAQHRAVFKRGG